MKRLLLALFLVGCSGTGNDFEPESLCFINCDGVDVGHDRYPVEDGWPLCNAQYGPESGHGLWDLCEDVVCDCHVIR